MHRMLNWKIFVTIIGITVSVIGVLMLNGNAQAYATSIRNDFDTTQISNGTASSGGVNISDSDTIRLVKLAFGPKADRVIAQMKNRSLERLPFRIPLSEVAVTYRGGKTHWVGYEAYRIQNDITCASGFYYVVAQTSGTGTDCTWVGVGGDIGGSYLAQVGVTMKTYSYNGESHYWAWYQRYPTDGEIMPVFQVDVGDEIASDVVYDQYTGYWNFFIEDVTSGSYFSQEFNFTPDRHTADWIIESPYSWPGPYYLGNFAQVDRWACWWMNSSWVQNPINSDLDTACYVDPSNYATFSPDPRSLPSNSYSFSITAPGNNPGNGY